MDLKRNFYVECATRIRMAIAGWIGELNLQTGSDDQGEILIFAKAAAAGSASR
jgi:hypothetical protein